MALVGRSSKFIWTIDQLSIPWLDTSLQSGVRAHSFHGQIQKGPDPLRRLPTLPVNHMHWQRCGFAFGQYHLQPACSHMFSHLVREQTRQSESAQRLGDGQRRGAKIVIELKDDCADFAQDWRMKEILERYSAFVSYPINLNGKRINTVQALWLRNKAEVKDEEYTEFYKFQAHAFDEPRLRLHFVGPAFQDVAAKYQGRADLQAYLSGKIRSGGQGLWGSIPMPPQTALPDADLQRIVDWLAAGASK